MEKNEPINSLNELVRTRIAKQVQEKQNEKQVIQHWNEADLISMAPESKRSDLGQD